ncbi:MAG: DUF2975 domain-containing protein [Clostridia bacterium]|nr:DUF2975 domain-containing protein [Clostridia bacterium]
MKVTKSVMFCLWTVRIFIAVSVVSLFFIPRIAEYYSMVASQGKDISLIITVVLYVLVIPAIATLSAMYLLLKSIVRNDIFTLKNVRYLNVITVCLFIVGIICGIVAFMTSFFAFISIPFLFMGLVLLVLRNVFSQAVEIKSENDLTV